MTWGPEVPIGSNYSLDDFPRARNAPLENLFPPSHHHGKPRLAGPQARAKSGPSKSNGVQNPKQPVKPSKSQPTKGPKNIRKSKTTKGPKNIRKPKTTKGPKNTKHTKRTKRPIHKITTKKRVKHNRTHRPGVNVIKPSSFVTDDEAQ